MDIIASSYFLCPFDIMPEQEKRALSDKFMLRLPDGMRDRIKAAADASNRSMNAEIVATLEEKYPARDDALIEALEQFSKQLPKISMEEALRRMKEFEDQIRASKEGKSTSP
ncbi:Arc family DNA-binding protein [Rhodobacter maris]|uniref:Arc-like DNA binding dprotein n=1 Tax=Rhodobacter maris TaxID=446682 RepID=A0A285S9U9_9RHOB|nr:Arc family DNA-binding protein [Rhodobacter maris]SOC02169.1 Arc-like DNA binding dprotein [Rhodobacter maris]